MKIGSHVSMGGKEMLLASAKEAISYGANTFMFYTGAPQNTRRKSISELNIAPAWDYMKNNGIEEIIVHAPYIINLGNAVKPSRITHIKEVKLREDREVCLTLSSITRSSYESLKARIAAASLQQAS